MDSLKALFVIAVIAWLLLIWFYLLARLVSWGAAKSWFTFLEKIKGQHNKKEGGE